MEIVTDTHALFWYLSREVKLRKQLSTKALNTLDKAKRIYIPTIVLLELESIFRKYFEQRKFSALLKRIKTNSRFKVVSLDFEIVVKSTKIRLDEIHDRVIVATAKVLRKPVVSKDREIKLAYGNTIW